MLISGAVRCGPARALGGPPKAEPKRWRRARRRAAAPLDYRGSRLLFCWEDGRPLHPDTITRRFKKLAASAGLPEIDLHDVRHSYATVGRDAKIDWKALSNRIGHSDVAFTMKQYVQTDLAADRQVANTLAELIIGGALVSIDIGSTAAGATHAGADDGPPRQPSGKDTAA